MPIYEYQCRECEHKFDEIQKVDAPPLTVCPECGLPELAKLMSAPSFRLKGQGWYETDFKKDNRRNLAGDAGGEGNNATSDKKSTDGSSDGSKKSDTPASAVAKKPASEKAASKTAQNKTSGAGNSGKAASSD